MTPPRSLNLYLKNGIEEPYPEATIPPSTSSNQVM